MLLCCEWPCRARPLPGRGTSSSSPILKFHGRFPAIPQLCHSQPRSAHSCSPTCTLPRDAAFRPVQLLVPFVCRSPELVLFANLRLRVFSIPSLLFSSFSPRCLFDSHRNPISQIDRNRPSVESPRHLINKVSHRRDTQNRSTAIDCALHATAWQLHSQTSHISSSRPLHQTKENSSSFDGTLSKRYLENLKQHAQIPVNGPGGRVLHELGGSFGL